MEAAIDHGYAPVNGVNMYYEVHGRGDIPLVLVHGGGSTIETSFGVILPLLAANRRVIALELEAHGRTAHREGDASFEQDADDVAALLRFLKVSTADLAGFSNGGNTVMEVALRHPGLVRKIVVVSSFFKRSGMIEGFFEGLQHACLGDMPGPLQQAFLDVTPDQERLQIMFDKDRNRMLRFRDWPDDMLRAITVPTLLVTADHDVMTTDHTVEMLHLIPEARLLIVPGIHGSFIGEVCTAKPGSRMPEMTVAVIEEFLSE